jgi:hypothetical protein
MNKVVIWAAEAIHFMIGTMGMFLKAAGWVQFAWNQMTFNLRALGLAFQAVIMAMLATVKGAIMSSPIGLIPGASDKIDSAINDLSDRMADSVQGMKQDSADSTQILDLAESFTRQFDEGSEYADKMRAMIDSAKVAANEASKEGAGASDRKNTKGKQTHIHHLEIRQDLRNHDPDRIMGAFIKKLEDVADRPTQAVTQENYGV